MDITTLYSKFLGYEPYELLGEEYINMVHPDEYERLAEIEKKPELSKEPRAWRLLRKDGETVFIKAFAKLVSASEAISVIDCISITEDEYNEDVSDAYYTESVKGES